MEPNWLTIGQVAKKFGIDSARLRDWCNKGLVEHDKKPNARYIPESEFEKIEKIRDFFDKAKAEGTRVTFDDVRTMLEKENLYKFHKVEKKKNEIAVQTEEAFANALNEMNFGKFIEEFLSSREETKGIKSDVNELKSSVNELQQVIADNTSKLLEEAEERYKKESEDKENKHQKELEQRNKEYAELLTERHEMKEMLHSIEAKLNKMEEKEITPEPPQKKGFFNRLFS